MKLPYRFDGIAELPKELQPVFTKMWDELVRAINSVAPGDGIAVPGGALATTTVQTGLVLQGTAAERAANYPATEFDTPSIFYETDTLLTYQILLGATKAANTWVALISRTTTLTTPTIYGGVAANDDITIEGTSSGTKTTSYVILQPTGGNVGIGTTGPASNLDIYGANSTIGNITQGNLHIQTSNAFGIDKGGSLTFGSKVSTVWRNMGGIVGRKENATDGNQAGYLGFWTNNNGVLGEKVRIDSSGNVGVGTTAQAAKLAINGGLHVGGDSDPGDNNLLVDGTLKVGTLGGATGSFSIFGSVGVAAISDVNQKAIYFYNDGTTVKIDAYDYGVGAALNLVLGGNGGNVIVTRGLHVGGASDPGDDNALIDGTGTITGAFGCNGKTAQTAYASGGAASTVSGTATLAGYGFANATEMNNFVTAVGTIVTLVNNHRLALIADGIES